MHGELPPLLSDYGSTTQVPVVMGIDGSFSGLARQRIADANYEAIIKAFNLTRPTAIACRGHSDSLRQLDECDGGLVRPSSPSMRAPSARV